MVARPVEPKGCGTVQSTGQTAPMCGGAHKEKAPRGCYATRGKLLSNGQDRSEYPNEHPSSTLCASADSHCAELEYPNL